MSAIPGKPGSRLGGGASLSGRALRGLPVAVAGVAILMAGLLGVGAAKAAAGSPSPTGDGAAASSGLSAGLARLEALQRRVVDDRDRAKRGRGRVRLGGLSDGVFGVHINRRDERVVIVMPILRAPLLERTRRLVARRYGDAPVFVRLSRLARLWPVTGDGIPSRPGRPLPCPASHLGEPVPPREAWNAKRIRGLRVVAATALARRHGCTVREVVIDGMSQAVTDDFSYGRVNVVTRHNRVTHVLGIY